ncbi:alpha/beta hydrolase family protein [Bradyrhizobium sp.]|uniref:alpha/beta hydrolase family protein n=1 Tax=Bradyrhizobium sp. TaxID=376 RepID=UPI004037E493
MRYAAWLALAIVLAALRPAAAQDYIREELRIAMPTAGPRGLEALLIRPAGSGPYPLALISHGSPRDGAARATMSANALYRQGIEFARRGFAALIVMRRGYATSGGEYAESSGPCADPDYLRTAKASANDLRATVQAMKNRTDVTTDGFIAVGVSAGGFASVALTADPPQGLAAAISFAGGRGSRTDNEVCNADALVGAFAALGRTSRIPMLWIYAQNDRFFGPALARRMHAAFTGAGGSSKFVNAAAFGEDGHTLFSRGIPIWTAMVDEFLRAQDLGRRDLLPPPAAAVLPPPPRLGEKGRTGFASYLSAGPHKAFAVSPRGSWASRSGLRSADEARQKALEACSKYAPDCAIYAVDDALTATADAAR